MMYIIENAENGKLYQGFSKDLYHWCSELNDATWFKEKKNAEEMLRNIDCKGKVVAYNFVKALDEKDDILKDMMSLEELPGLADDLKRWETSLLMCAIVGILDKKIGASEGEYIKNEVEKVSAVRAFIEKRFEK